MSLSNILLLILILGLPITGCKGRLHTGREASKMEQNENEDENGLGLTDLDPDVLNIVVKILAFQNQTSGWKSDKKSNAKMELFKKLFGTETELPRRIATFFKGSDLKRLDNGNFLLKDLDVPAFKAELKEALKRKVGWEASSLTKFLEIEDSVFLNHLTAQAKEIVKQHKAKKLPINKTEEQFFLDNLVMSQKKSTAIFRDLEKANIDTWLEAAVPEVKGDVLLREANYSNLFTSPPLSESMQKLIPTYFQSMNKDQLKEVLRVVTTNDRPNAIKLLKNLIPTNAFGPFFVKSLQQEAIYLSTQEQTGSKATASNESGDVVNFFKASFERSLQETDKITDDVKIAYGSLTTDQKKALNAALTGNNPDIKIKGVLKAGSLGITFQLEEDDRVLKWIRPEIRTMLEHELSQLDKSRKNLDQNPNVGNAVVDLEAQESQIKGYIEELDLYKEATNTERLAESFKGHPYIKVMGARGCEGCSFNIQERAKGKSLKDLLAKFNTLGEHHKFQIRNAMEELRNQNFEAIQSGKYFHDDLHEGNIFIELNEDGLQPTSVSLIDAGSVQRLDDPQRQALATFLDFAKGGIDLKSPAFIEAVKKLQKNPTPDKDFTTHFEKDVEKLGLYLGGEGIISDTFSLRRMGFSEEIIAALNSHSRTTLAATLIEGKLPTQGINGTFKREFPLKLAEINIEPMREPGPTALEEARRSQQIAEKVTILTVSIPGEGATGSEGGATGPESGATGPESGATDNATNKTPERSPPPVTPESRQTAHVSPPGNESSTLSQEQTSPTSRVGGAPNETQPRRLSVTPEPRLRPGQPPVPKKQVKGSGAEVLGVSGAVGSFLLMGGSKFLGISD